MVRRWSKRRSWLVFWQVLALLWFAIGVNRFQRTDAFVSYDIGVTPMAWGLLMDFLFAAAASAVCAVVGLLPAAWMSLGPSRGGVETDQGGSSGPDRSSAGPERSNIA